MNYHIGEVAELFGITKGGVRHYEKIGILQPTRDESGYRVYSRHNITDLKRMRAYQSMGFSLEEAHSMALCESAQALMDKLDQKERILKRQIELLDRTAQMLGVQREAIREAREQADNWTLCERPEFYRIPVWQERRGGAGDSPEQRRRMLAVEQSWTAAMPVVQLCDYYYWQAGELRYEKGSCVLREDAERFGLNLDSALVEHYRPQTCLMAYIRAPIGGAVCRGVEAGIAHAWALGHRLGEAMVGRQIMLESVDGVRYSITRVTLPIEGDDSPSPNG